MFENFSHNIILKASELVGNFVVQERCTIQGLRHNNCSIEINLGRERWTPSICAFAGNGSPITLGFRYTQLSMLFEIGFIANDYPRDFVNVLILQMSECSAISNGSLLL